MSDPRLLEEVGDLASQNVLTGLTIAINSETFGTDQNSPEILDLTKISRLLDIKD